MRIPQSQAESPNDEKFRELLIYICEQSEGDRRFGATKLNKLLFFADFLTYAERGRSITGHCYQKLPNGPAPRALLPILGQLEDEGAVKRVRRTYHGREQIVALALREANLNVFDAPEIDVVRDVLKDCRGMNATEMSDLSHEFSCWQLAEMHEDIPYESAIVSFEEQEDETADFGEDLRKELSRLKQECEGMP